MFRIFLIGTLSLVSLAGRADDGDSSTDSPEGDTWRNCPAAASPACPLQITVPASKAISSSGIQFTPIPNSFLGFSQEWPWLSNLTGSEHIFSIFKSLRNGKRDPLVLRVGGFDADAGWDKMYDPNHKEYHSAHSAMRRESMKGIYAELARLKQQAGFNFIASVNFAKRNLGLATQQANQIKSVLGHSLLSLEIGNEPNYYLDNAAAYWNNKETFYIDMVNELDRFASKLNCSRNCSGPAWGWVGMRPEMINNYLNKSSKRLNYLTIHYYKSAFDPARNDNDTAETLLNETDVIRKWIEPQVAASRKFGVPVRFTETNSISGGGNEGVSNAFASSLWTLDTCLSFAAAGVAGIDFHQGSYKYSMYKRINRSQAGGENTPLEVNYKIQPSFYGMLLFQMANRDGSSINKLKIDAAFKVKGYQLESAEGRRTILINKDSRNKKTVTLALPVKHSGTVASVIELRAPGNKPGATSGITLAGQSYDNWGAAKSGNYVQQQIKGKAGSKAGVETFTFELQPATAIMLRVN